MVELSSQSFEAEPSAASAQEQGLTVEMAIAHLTHTDLSLRYYAAWWLGRFQASEPAAVDALIGALADQSDRTELGGYPLRRNAARALGKLSDRRAVPSLVGCLGCSDFYVREAAAQSLGLLGDPSSIPALLPLLAGGVAAAERVPGRPHLAQPCEAVLEALGNLAPGSTWQAATIEQVKPFLQHPLPRVQYAAARALYQLTQETVYGDRLVQALHGEDINLRRAALSDLGAVGYLPAAEAIAHAATENSFKLFSLKGLLLHHLQVSDAHSDDAIALMTLMDQLL